MLAAAGPRLPWGRSIRPAADLRYYVRRTCIIPSSSGLISNQIVLSWRTSSRATAGCVLCSSCTLSPLRKLASSLGAVRYPLSARASTKELVALLNAVRRGGRCCNTPLIASRPSRLKSSSPNRAKYERTLTRPQVQAEADALLPRSARRLGQGRISVQSQDRCAPSRCP